MHKYPGEVEIYAAGGATNVCVLIVFCGFLVHEEY